VIQALVLRNPHRPIGPLVSAIRGVDEGALEADTPLTAEEVVSHPGLARVKSFDIAGVLLSGITSEDADLRSRTLWPLAETRDPRAIQALKSALRDPVLQVRASAAEALVYAGAEARDDLTRLLATDPEPDVRVAAAESLATIGGEEAVDALKQAQSDRSRVVRKAATQALRELRRRHRLHLNPQKELRVYEKGVLLYERAERHLGKRVAWMLYLLVLRPLEKLYFKIRDDVP
jgi:HEAT repeat protein